MKSTKGSLILFSIASLAISLSCNSSGDSGWEYRYSFVASGTRSEHVVGVVMFDRKVMSKTLNHIITPIGEFIYVDEVAFAFPPQTNWVPCRLDPTGTLTKGYYAATTRELLKSKNGRRTSDAKVSTNTVSQLEMKAGFYTSSFDGKLANTPPSWFYSVGLRCWANPLAVDDLPIK